MICSLHNLINQYRSCKQAFVENGSKNSFPFNGSIIGHSKKKLNCLKTILWNPFPFSRYRQNENNPLGYPETTDEWPWVIPPRPLNLFYIITIISSPANPFNIICQKENFKIRKKHEKLRDEFKILWYYLIRNKIKITANMNFKKILVLHLCLEQYFKQIVARIFIDSILTKKCDKLNLCNPLFAFCSALDITYY